MKIEDIFPLKYFLGLNHFLTKMETNWESKILVRKILWLESTDLLIMSQNVFQSKYQNRNFSSVFLGHSHFGLNAERCQNQKVCVNSTQNVKNVFKNKNLEIEKKISRKYFSLP